MASSATLYRLVYDALFIAAGIGAAGLALFILWAAPVSASGLLLSLNLAAAALVASDAGRFHLIDAGLAALGLSPGAQAVGNRLLFAATLATNLAAGLRWTQLFPRRLDRRDIDAHARNRFLRSAQLRFADARASWIGIGVGGFVVFALSALLLRPWLYAQLLVSLTLAIAVTTIGMLNLRTNFRAGTPAERYRIYWVFEAFIVGVGLALLALITELMVHVLRASHPVAMWLHATLLPLVYLSMIALLAVAVLYAGALDSRLVIRKTMLYGATGVVLTGVFVAIEGIASELLTGRLGVPERAGGWFGGLVVALIFGPVKEKVERRLGKVMDRRLPQQIAPTEVIVSR